MKRLYALFLAGFFTITFFTCEELETLTEGNGTTSSQTAQELVDSANTALGKLMSQMVSNPPEPPFDGDYSAMQQVNDLYKQALSEDAQHADANFGAGLTELLLLVDDGSAFVEEINRWEAFMDTTDLFGTSLDSQEGMSKVGTGHTQLFNSNPFALRSGSQLSAVTYLKAMTSLPKYAQDYPEFGEWQNLIESTILERVNSAIANLSVVEEVDSFRFEVTPEMQGDEAASPREIDLTEVYMFDAALHGIQTICNMVIAYNVNLSPYDSTAFSQLEPGGSFMTLRREGAMSTALDGIFGMLNKADSGLVFLRDETDDQADDIIMSVEEEIAGQPGLTDPQIVVARQTIDSVRIVFSGPVDVPINSGEQPVMKPAVTAQGDLDDQMITVDIRQLFADIEDFKSWLPGYDIVAGVDTSYEYFTGRDSLEDGATGIIGISEGGEYLFQYGLDFNPESGINPWIVQDNDIESIPGFEQAVDNQMDQLLAMDLPEGQEFESINVWVFWIGNYTEGGTYDVMTDVHWEYQVKAAVFETHYPVPIWDASNYPDWLNTWSTEPSRTFYGVFPNFTQDDWKSIFMDMGINEDTWVKDMRNFVPGDPPILY